MTAPDKEEKNNNKINGSVQNANGTPQVSAHRVFVSHISPKTTIQSLKEYFSLFGPISECSLKTRSRPRNGIYEQFAFIRYPNMDDAKNCLKLEWKHVVDGWRVTAQEAIDECGSVNLEGTTVIPQKIFVGGLPATCDQAKLTNAFSQYGRIVDSMVSVDQKTNRSRLFGFVEFEDSRSVDDALKDYHAHRIDGKWVETKRCIPRDVIPTGASKNRRSKPLPPVSKGRQRKKGAADSITPRSLENPRRKDSGDEPGSSADYPDRMHLDYDMGSEGDMDPRDKAPHNAGYFLRNALSNDRWGEYNTSLSSPYGLHNVNNHDLRYATPPSLLHPSQASTNNSHSLYYHDYASPPRAPKGVAMEARQALGESLAINNMIPFLLGTNVAEVSFLPTLQEMIVARCEYLDKSYGVLCGMKTHELIAALEYAASRNMPDVVRMLITSGADINSRCTGGLTPLLIAAARGYQDVVHVLLKAGALVVMPETREDRAVLASLAAQSAPYGEKPRSAEDIVMELLVKSWDGDVVSDDERGMGERRKRAGMRGLFPAPSDHTFARDGFRA